VPAAPVRRKPNHRKELVNQLLFGETVKVLKQKGDLWVKIRSLHDGYEGWLTNTLLKEADEDFANTRDAWQQGQEGKAVKKLKDALPGDLAFFDRGEEMVHVGILLGNEKIIHASGRVRIDSVDKKGIIDAETGKRTMRLKSVRRVL